MENKYYTPSIEEFHVGFEYELKSYSVDISKVEDHTNITREEVDSCAVNFIGWFTNTYDGSESPKNLELDRIRVKHLDREDIESLGFESLPIDVDSDFNTYDFKKGPWLLQIWNSLGRGSVSIEKEQLEGHVNTVHFVGKLKNKSELKRLLKQLGI